MAEQLNPIILQQSHAQALREDAARRLSRTPNPYHRQQSELAYGSERFDNADANANIPPKHSLLRSTQTTDDEDLQVLRVPSRLYRDPTNSDSGTEADDEHFLKGLPAPKARPHKGLRGGDGNPSGSPSPILSPAILEENTFKSHGYLQQQSKLFLNTDMDEATQAARRLGRKRKIEVVRRSAEAAILCSLGGLLCLDSQVREVLYLWRKELACQFFISTSLVAAYPWRLLRHLQPSQVWKRPLPIAIPATFEPAALIYPPAITILVTVILSRNNPTNFLSSISLGIASLPRQLIPSTGGLEGSNISHWALTCLPMLVSDSTAHDREIVTRGNQINRVLSPEVLVLLYPLHQALCHTLHYLTTTSLLPAELQLLSISLIHLLLLARSPQATILKALLWGGGVGMLISCGHVLIWGVALARVPKWRFRRAPNERGVMKLLSLGNIGRTVFGKDAALSESSAEDEPAEIQSTRLELNTRDQMSAYEEPQGSGSLSAIDPKTKVNFTNGAVKMSGNEVKQKDSVGSKEKGNFFERPGILFPHAKAGHYPEMAASFGPANTRLILCGYWLAIIIAGLATVFRLSSIYEVDTRRKVFHFMMVAMLLPATYVDPTFAALALSLMLAIFLLLDLFRASQLPPLSKHLAYFLTPYVDGRDLKGPVVISHIFLLIGCAIPLWLSLGTLPQTGNDYLSGWEVPTREVSMVSGVICVGMGDAAASLIGRRYGRRKWLWGGGKSIEGSVAFATAVGLALVLAKAWLRIGGWPANNNDAWFITIGKAGVAAWVASLTEAALTGGNDNVVVPVVLWLCVKGLDI
ncbi:uncharacterized protein L3040_008105 [Drepanopeziza brunnea f. sp. 'multigermtubi']|uniref:uncharacterized protein n=1 Tax=Drepanopeziza brunnea f. sp. 'multigermtubi' TaxID=698441 RepID=UPI0023A5FE8E|nr:hypothetical protein L3040_008105 [Drepanopeziza brunnea f. sp. 'multigermtubi']